MSKADSDSLTASRDVSRRDFVQTAVAGTVGTGFAAAVLPVKAQSVIKTDAAGLEVGEVNIMVGDFRMPAYRAMPAGKKHLPVVLVISEIFGVHEHIADVARRFAKLGYMAIAPDLFIRQGDAKAAPDISKLISDIINEVPDDQVMSDLDATAAWAKSQGGDTSKLAVTGFCWGGRITWLYAAHNPAIKVGAAWYGGLVGAPSALRPRHPVDVAGQLNGPVLGLYGGQDGGIPLETVEKMRLALAQGSDAAKRSMIQVYPDAPHGFHADYRPGYLKEAADDAWKRTLDWFRANGVV